MRGEQLAGLDRQRVDELARELTEAASLGAWSTDDGTDPWFGARIATSAEALRAQDIASRLAQDGLQDVQRAIDEVFAEVTLPEAERVSDWGTVLDTVGRVRDTLEVFRPEVFDIPLGDLVAATGTKEFRETSGVALGWYARRRLRRQARGLLRPGTPPADLHGAPRRRPAPAPGVAAHGGRRRPSRDPGRPRPGPHGLRRPGRGPDVAR